MKWAPRTELTDCSVLNKGERKQVILNVKNKELLKYHKHYHKSRDEDFTVLYLL